MKEKPKKTKSYRSVAPQLLQMSLDLKEVIEIKHHLLLNKHYIYTVISMHIG